MRTLIWPFWSQQDKTTGKFLPHCGGPKLGWWLHNRIKSELGWQSEMVSPMPFQLAKQEYYGDVVQVYMPNSNKLQRVHWDTETIRLLTDGVDLVVTSNEFAAIPLRAVKPSLKIISMVVLYPEPEGMFREAWNSSDLVVFQCKSEYERWRTDSKFTWWNMAFDADLYKYEECNPRPIDVVFLGRCSESNYTHHQEFLRAVGDLDLKYVVCDSTKYLRRISSMIPVLADPSDQTAYRNLLSQSKVCVALVGTGYGGMSVREAVASGCWPVVSRSCAYLDLVGYSWPGVCYHDDPVSIREAVQRVLALREAGARDSLSSFKFIEARAFQHSYQEGWKKVKEDLLCLSR